VDVNASFRDLIDVNAYIEGPIVRDKLSGSFSARYYDKQGHYEASDGGRLGDESTMTFNGKLFYQPTDNLNFRFRASYSEDDDGAPATAYVAGQVPENDSCSGRTITSGAGETAMPMSYICGAVPTIDTATPVADSILIDGNTIVPDNVGAFLFDGPRPNNAPRVTDMGMKRETLRLSAHATYDLNDYTFDASIGYNDQAVNWIRDFDLSGFSNAWSQDPQGLQDTSYEVRVTSPQDGRFRWAAGVNYYEQTFTSSGAGGNFVFSCIGTGNPAAPCVPDLALNFGNSFANSDESEVTGIFGAVDFDITDQLTLTVEGRFQRDQLVKGGASTVDGLASGALTIETEDFLPRVILRWQPSDSTMIFGSYALGVVPGDVNQQFLNADDRERPQYLAVFPNLAESTPQEELTSIEFGLKQYLWNGRAYFNASIFFQEWTGIKGRSSVAVNETCDASGINEINVATGCTYPGVMVGDGKMIDDPMNPGTLIPFLNARNVLLDGDADINGLELEFGGQLNDYISLDAAVAYVDTEYTRYIFNFVQRIAGFSDMRGNSTPRTPEWSGNLSSTFRMPTAEGREVFVRADLNYMGEVFTDETNLAYLEDYWIVNLRGGFDTERYRVEGYIKNLFNEEKWTTGARFSDTAFPVDFTNFFVQQGVNLTPQNKTEVGLRALFRF